MDICHPKKLQKTPGTPGLQLCLNFNGNSRNRWGALAFESFHCFICIFAVWDSITKHKNTKTHGPTFKQDFFTWQEPRLYLNSHLCTTNLENKVDFVFNKVQIDQSPSDVLRSLNFRANVWRRKFLLEITLLHIKAVIALISCTSPNPSEYKQSEDKRPRPLMQTSYGSYNLLTSSWMT